MKEITYTVKDVLLTVLSTGTIRVPKSMPFKAIKKVLQQSTVGVYGGNLNDYGVSFT